ncbi:MAG: hypothetical protein K8F62_10915 [Pseudorhodoplanes sp.]|nr:hypothetical protein [Pseudorhodoplanes sp.]
MDTMPIAANVVADEPSAHSTESSLREKIIEHLFVGDLLRCLWRRGDRDVEVLRPEVDRGGYDLVLEVNGITRHIQLKSSYRGAATSQVNAHVNLVRKPSACIIWIMFDPQSLELGPFLWFGGSPREAIVDLGDKVARYSKGNKDGYKAERPNHRVVKKGRFQVLHTIDDVADALFGDRSAELDSSAALTMPR